MSELQGGIKKRIISSHKLWIISAVAIPVLLVLLLIVSVIKLQCVIPSFTSFTLCEEHPSQTAEEQSSWILLQMTQLTGILDTTRKELQNKSGETDSFFKSKVKRDSVKREADLVIWGLDSLGHVSLTNGGEYGEEHNLSTDLDARIRNALQSSGN